MQHELFINPNRRTRRDYPLLVVLQADIVEGDDKITAPLMPAESLVVLRNRALPTVRHDGQDYRVFLTLIGSVNQRRLGRSVGSLHAYRFELVQALDWLLVGF